MRLFVLTIVVALTLIVTGTLGLSSSLAHAKTYCNATSCSSTCQEDMRCWNWRTMGNKRRGIVTNTGHKLIVQPGTFDLLNRSFRIDWSRTRYLRGDGHRWKAAR